MQKLWNLGRVKQIVEEATGLDISHVYDDIVFIEHSAFLIVFDHENLERFKCYFSADCPPDERERIFSLINAVSPRNKMTALRAGTFSMEQLEGEEIRFLFHDEV